MYETLGLILLIIGMGVIDFSLRYAFFFLFRNQTAPAYISEWLPFIPAAALSALIAPAVLGSGHAMAAQPSPKLIAWLVAAFIAWRTRNAFLTILSGMAILWLLQFLWDAAA